MNKLYSQYQQAINSNRNFRFKSFLFFLLFIVHFCFPEFSKIFAQPGGKVDPNGYNVFYFENGNKSSEGEMKDGKPIGYWKTYYENGNLKSEGSRKDFQLDSIWKFYTEEGVLKNEIQYRENKKHGISKKYNAKGELVSEINFADNVRSGEGKYFHETGELKKLVPFHQDKENGMAYEYAKDGRIISIIEYTGGFMRSIEEINRMDDNGKKDGWWKEFHDNGKVKWEGVYKHGVIDGIVREYTAKGGLKTIEMYEEGKVNENAEEVEFFELQKEVRPDGSVLVGGYAKDMKQGIFREYSEDGKLLNSYKYKDGVKLAEGLLDTAGMEQGKWKYFYNSGELKAEGEFQNGKKVKEWTFYHKNGVIQQKGSYKNGLASGYWKWWYENKQLHREETFRLGKEDGESIEYDTLGNILTHGEFIDGIREGKWYYHVNDHTEEGEYRDGGKHGVWTFKYDNGKINFVGEYLNGLPIGKHKFYYPSGRKKWDGKYENGEKEGEWRKFDEEGKVVLTIYYRRGVEYKLDGNKIKPALEIP